MKKILWLFGIGFLILIIVVSVGVGFYIGPIAKIGAVGAWPQNN